MSLKQGLGVLVAELVGVSGRALVREPSRRTSWGPTQRQGRSKGSKKLARTRASFVCLRNGAPKAQQQKLPMSMRPAATMRRQNGMLQEYAEAGCSWTAWPKPERCTASRMRQATARRKFGARRSG